MARKKTGGKVKGSKNKLTLARLEALEQITLEVGINPFKELLLLARDSSEDAIRLMALKEACKYLYAQKKAIEVSGKDDSGIKVIIEDYTSRK
jgi:hypothetical protein